MTTHEEVRPVTVTERIALTLQGEIFNGTLKPGDRLPAERELAQSHRANRNAVREALKRLEQIGLLKTRHGSGTTVQNYLETGSLETLLSAQVLPDKVWRDALDFRVYQGPAIAHLAATRGDGRKAHALAGQVLELVHAQSADAWVRAEHGWMSALVAAAENQLFTLVHNAVAPAFKPERLFEHRGELERGYQSVGELVGQRDAPRAMSKMWSLMAAQRAWLSALPYSSPATRTTNHTAPASATPPESARAPRR
jgi:DNA-binding FadR family transcriptional regulator